MEITRDELCRLLRGSAARLLQLQQLLRMTSLGLSPAAHPALSEGFEELVEGLYTAAAVLEYTPPADLPKAWPPAEVTRLQAPGTAP